MRTLLQLAGRHGALVVIGGLILGFAIPALAEAARPLLALAVLIFTFGSFLKLDAGAAAQEWARAPRSLMVALWATLGVPLVVAAGLAVIDVDPGLAQGVLLWAAVPTSAACVAFAAILGLSPSLALVATVVGTAAAPLLLPVLLAITGSGIALAADPLQMCVKLLALLGGAALLALLARRLAGRFIEANPDVMTGIAVAALVLAGVGSMRGAQAAFVADPARVLGMLLLAYGLLAVAQLSATMMFWRLLDPKGAMSAGLAAGSRTITLAWVVLGSQVTPQADLFLAMAMVAKYTAPALTRMLSARWVPRAQPA